MEAGFPRSNPTLEAGKPGSSHASRPGVSIYRPRPSDRMRSPPPTARSLQVKPGHRVGPAARFIVSHVASPALPGLSPLESEFNRLTPGLTGVRH